MKFFYNSFILIFIFIGKTNVGGGQSKLKKGKGPVLSLTKKDVMRLMFPKPLHCNRQLATDSLDDEKIEKEKNDTKYSKNNSKVSQTDNIRNDEITDLVNDAYDVSDERILTEETGSMTKNTKISQIKNTYVRTVPQGDGPKDWILEMTLKKLHERVC